MVCSIKLSLDWPSFLCPILNRRDCIHLRIFDILYTVMYKSIFSLVSTENYSEIASTLIPPRRNIVRVSLCWFPEKTVCGDRVQNIEAFCQTDMIWDIFCPCIFLSQHFWKHLSAQGSDRPGKHSVRWSARFDVSHPSRAWLRQDILRQKKMLAD